MIKLLKLEYNDNVILLSKKRTYRGSRIDMMVFHKVSAYNGKVVDYMLRVDGWNVCITKISICPN